MIDKSITTDVVFDSELLISEYNSLTINRGDYTNFINENVSTFNIELLLSSYLYNGSRKEELKKIILPFLRSEVTRSLYGMREVLTYHLVNSKFLKKIGITDTYNIGNLLDVLKNKNSIIQTFYNNNSVWKISMLDHDCYGFLLNIGSQSMISFKDITDNDISNIRKFLADIGISETDSVGIEWNYLLDLIPLIKADTITDNQLNDIIVHQSSQESCVTTCTFYSVSFPTVNTYFIQYILNQNNENNTKILAPYVI